MSFQGVIPVYELDAAVISMMSVIIMITLEEYFGTKKESSCIYFPKFRIRDRNKLRRLPRLKLFFQAKVHRANKKLLSLKGSGFKIYINLKGLSHEIHAFFWLEWIYLGLNSNCFFFLRGFFDFTQPF